jgi:hypothetical protein
MGVNADAGVQILDVQMKNRSINHRVIARHEAISKLGITARHTGPG